MQSLLVVAYYFPPHGGAGVQRTLKFVKYLPEFNWQALVLTAVPRGGQPKDPGLTVEIPTETTIYRTKAKSIPSWFPWRLRNFISRWLLVVDDQIGWLPFAVGGGKRIIRNHRIDAIFTTSSPYTDHLIGYLLKRRTNLPWIADFRDPWIGNFSSSFPTPIHAQIASRLESLVINHADRVTVVSEPMRKALLDRYPALPEEKIKTLPNGFDPDDFKVYRPHIKEDGKFHIVYTGSFYGPKQTPIYFLKSLQKALDSGLIPRERIRVSLIGNTGKYVFQLVEDLDLSDVVRISGFLPHDKSVGHLFSADLLLLIIGSGPGSEGVLTGKIFEYLAARKHIFGLVPPGAARDLICSTKSGTVVDPEDIEGITASLHSLFLRWERNELGIRQDLEKVEVFNRRNITSRLAELLEKITSQSTMEG
jgi:glycosyltransferase involved in cell wall biosynthesis